MVPGPFDPERIDVFSQNVAIPEDALNAKLLDQEGDNVLQKYPSGWNMETRDVDARVGALTDPGCRR